MSASESAKRHTLADLEARPLELDALTPRAGLDLPAGQLRLTRGAADTRVADHPDDAPLGEYCRRERP